MVQFTGADVDELERVAEQLRRSAERLETIAKALSARLNHSTWDGRDAIGFRAQWQMKLRPGISAAAGRLREAGIDLANEAEQQREASRDLGPGAAAALGAALGRSLGVDRQMRGDKQVDDPSAKGAGRFKVIPGFWEITWGRKQLKDFRDVPLFGANSSGPEPLISSGDVAQGALGDCYLMAALAAMAETSVGREAIARAIKDNGDGTFTVTFADGEKVTVDDDFYVDDKGNPLYANVGEVIWPAVLEEAYAKKRGSFGEIGEGGNPSEVFVALGFAGERVSMSDVSKAELRAILYSGEPVAFAATLANSAGFTGPGYGATDAHAFSVVETNVGATGETFITLRNPWGSNGRLELQGIDREIALNSDGTFVVTLDEAQRIFYQVDYVGAS